MIKQAFRQFFLELSEIDRGCLVLFRVVFSLLVAADCMLRYSNYSLYYASDSVLPLPLAMEFYNPVGSIQLFGMVNSEVWGHGIFLFLLVSSLCLMIGLKANLMKYFVWISLLAVQHRNPLTLSGADDLLRVLSFWLLFLPLHNPKSLFNQEKIRSFASLAIKFQVVAVYWMVLLHRTHSSWWDEGSATFLAMQLDHFITPGGYNVRLFIEGLDPALQLYFYNITTWLTTAAELLLPTLIFFSPFPARWRSYLIAGMIIFHFSLGQVLFLGLFPMVSSAGFLLFLPQVPSLVRTLMVSIGERIRAVMIRFRPAWEWMLQNLGGSDLVAHAEKPRMRLHIKQIILFAAFAVMLQNNIQSTAILRQNLHTGPSLAKVARFLGLNQNWSMFSPFPLTTDGYFEIQGTSKGGDFIDVLAMDRSPKYKETGLLSHQFRDTYHRKYLGNLRKSRHKKARSPYAKYLCRQYNKGKSSLSPDSLDTFKILHYKHDANFSQLTQSRAAPPYSETLLWTHYCFGVPKPKAQTTKSLSKVNSL